MKRILQLALASLILFEVTGCQSAKLASLNPLNFLPSHTKEEDDEADANLEKSLAESNSKTEDELRQQVNVNAEILKGQQDIAAWYQDQQRSHLASARKHFELALETQPRNNADAHHGLAVVADLEENFADAERHYQLALALDPRNSRILGNLGYSYFLQDRMGESERYLSRALQVDPSNYDAVRNLGDVYAQQGRREKALATYSRVMSQEQAEQLYLETVPEEERPSITERLLARDEPTEANDITNQILQMREQQRRSQQDLQQTAQLGPNPVNSNLETFPSRQTQGDLNTQLAAIDRESRRSLANSPIVIDGETGNPRAFGDNSLPSQAGYDQRFAANSQQQQFDGQIMHQPGPHREPMGNRFEMPGNRVVTADLPQIREGMPGNEIAQVHYENRPQFANPASTDQRFSNADADARHELSYAEQLRKPWSGLSDTNQNSSGPTNLQEQDAQTSWNQQSPQPSHRPDVSTGQDVNSYAEAIQSRHQGGDVSDRMDAFREASLRAAILGMGLPVRQPATRPNVEHQNSQTHTTPRQTPGTNSRWNGGEFQEPPRYIPSEAPTQDLSRAAEFASNQQQIRSSLGQHVPQSDATRSPEQFGTASRFQLQTANVVQPESWNNGQSSPKNLDSARNRFNQQLNAQVEQTWGNRPMTTHQPADSGHHLRLPAEYAGMAQQQSNHPIVVPAEYPQQATDQNRHPLMSSNRELSRHRGVSNEQHPLTANQGRMNVEQLRYDERGDVFSSSQLPTVVPVNGVQTQRSSAPPQPTETDSHSRSTGRRLRPAQTQHRFDSPQTNDLPADQDYGLPMIRPSGR